MNLHDRLASEIAEALGSDDVCDCAAFDAGSCAVVVCVICCVIYVDDVMLFYSLCSNNAGISSF